ncbi:hypothetical protein C0Q70_07861 [Pomacea canaliculata]|uniref:Uncharacterized protein n=1 Tax=Pomacea canaliculata TaxID=400727 RepID=A0A2T7PG68_POMCA|nr:hypothetical protein C0Q70_07861 [Pomacea canaliculata]
MESDDSGDDSGEDRHGAKSKKTLATTFHTKGLLVASFIVFWLVFFSLLFLQLYMACLSRRSQQILNQLAASKRNIPQNVYDLYFDYLEWGADMDQVDLRANTSIFVH